MIFKVTAKYYIKFAHAAATLPFQSPLRHQPSTACSVPSFGEHLLGFGNGLRRIEIFGAGIRTVHYRMTPVKTERVVQVIQSFSCSLVPAVD